MSSKKYQLDNYRKYLLNRVSASAVIIDYIENCLSSEDEGANHSFHKIMIHNWSDTGEKLFSQLGEYFTPAFIPVNYTSQGEITSFYTSSLSFILKVIKLDFMFPYQRNMFSLDILFNDKTSGDCFEGRVTIEDIVTGVVSGRMNDKFELDLSNFCSDPEFIEKKIYFYKISLLSQFKLLMLRMGKDTKLLNLSNNKLSQVPMDVLNFFIKGELRSVNLSNNNIPSIAELHRVSSKIEKLWVEGNPLCDDLDSLSYVKQLIMKFPRLIELDGINLNSHYGLSMPFFRNYVARADRKTKMFVDKFLTLYFTNYDWNPRSLDNFYCKNVVFTMTTGFNAIQKTQAPYYGLHSRNIVDPVTRTPYCKKEDESHTKRIYSGRASVMRVLQKMPESVHDPTTFTVDVINPDKCLLTVIVDGVFKEKTFDVTAEKVFRFRRTFVFVQYNSPQLTINNTVYQIANEMFHIDFASKEQINNSFKSTIRNLNSLILLQPEPEEMDAVCKAFMHFTQLKREEALLRLKINNWDLRQTMKEFIDDMKMNVISDDRFLSDDDFTDTSSLMDEVD